MKKLAIIGTGISGLGAAYLLHKKYDITIYEKEPRAGGHARTIDIDYNGKQIAVDTGFIVFNYRNYPHLAGLFNELDVKVEKSDMSLGLSLENKAFEWGCADLNAVFAQRSNAFKPRFWAMIRDILRFNKQAEGMIQSNDSLTLGELLKILRMGEDFRNRFLLPTAGAIWSSSPEQILDFPAHTFITFFKNHGLLTVNDQPQWYTVTQGSRNYVNKIIALFPDKMRYNAGVAAVTRQEDGVKVTTYTGDTALYDGVIFATHSDQALAMLTNPSKDEQQILQAIPYQVNRAYVHRDTDLMPKRTACWSSWNYLCDEAVDERARITVTYWMNRLQNIDKSTPIFVTLNPPSPPKDHLIFDETVFEHPVYSLEMIAAQARIPDIQGKDRIWYCGAYQRYGFHEDGLLSAVNVATSLGVGTPW